MEWTGIESDDMFQTASFCGGYDADENAFCFSFFSKSGKEYWFQLTIKEITDISNRKVETIEVRAADY
ncbi:hypothetical protein [Desulfatibacillum aliphaticivorans]|uniref:hypothetical protein n=1 Tax=Desulfatibacillum aliphaticivorans TaxID=218208 RepID=UPI0006850FEA|nr:hypothetical protein [Desulfatibacillum aliphaticivorans]